VTTVAASCRGCGAPLRTTFVDLGSSPLSNSFVSAEKLLQPEPTYPLHAFVCDACFLVQLEAYSTREDIFGDDYAYFSSYSESWLEHARAYAAMTIERFALGRTSRVVEIASNDGYLLQYFAAAGIPVLGIEPAESVANAARKRGVTTRTIFFGANVGNEYRTAGECADLIIANNVLAHVPDLHDFLAGVAALLGADGWATFEFPHVLELIRRTEFDTIYHEHYSYFSLLALEPLLALHGLAVVEASPLATHGGSLRLYIRHRGKGVVQKSVERVRSGESAARLDQIETYAAFPTAVEACRTTAREFFAAARCARALVLGYGAPAKGNTFLNYCSIGKALLPFTVDRNAYKVGKFLPGTHIPIRSVGDLADARPDYVLILPWNLRDEIERQLPFAREQGTKFVTAIPTIHIRE
jgi:SAM-dependent methyltransferase